MKKKQPELSRREKLEIQAQNIKMVEIRIHELEIALRKESDIKKKLLMQSSLKANKEMLALLKDQYFSEAL